jgi:hypothetical protein
VVSGAVIGSITGGFNAAIHGGNLGDVLQGAAISGVQGALSGALHGFEPASFGFNSESALHVAGHGVVGGASNAAMGGKFQDGFISAAVSAAASNAGAFRRIQGTGAGAAASRTALAGVIGGTASALGGGKFSNGAWTSAFQHLLNHEIDNIKELTAQWRSNVGSMKAVKSHIENQGNFSKGGTLSIDQNGRANFFL